MFWQKDIETISRRALEELQLKRLKQTVRQAYKNIPFYKKSLSKLHIAPKDITSLKDIQKLPFTTREDLREHYPFGMLAVPKEQVVRLHTSSGTTGKPKAIFFSKKDVDRAAELIARCLIMTGINKGDVLQNMMTYGLFTGALVMHYGAEKVGVLVIPAGPGNTKRQIALMQDFRTTTLHVTPSYALYLASVIHNEGLDPKKDLFLRRAYMGSEPYSEETRIKIETSLGIDVYNSYGLSEMNGPGVAFECMEKNGMHLWEDNFIMELIDPDTGEKMPEGEKGELVLTTLYREAMPILRYRTRDIVTIIPGRCKCGRTHRRISRIIGRSDDMIIIRGVNIFPQQIERVLMGIKAVAQNYQIVLEAYDQMTVRVEISRELFDGKVDHLVNLQNEITEKLRSEILVKPKVELLEPGALPVSEGKATRVIDKRTL
ncbi:MAG: phenylacetate--CoA ligase family protein [Candidatus Atribacteria bacterium]|nr:MAG: phenylacetate--CoA ligase family protein [Candidatus Atribacteria bacterium]